MKFKEYYNKIMNEATISVKDDEEEDGRETIDVERMLNYLVDNVSHKDIEYKINNVVEELYEYFSLDKNFIIKLIKGILSGKNSIREVEGTIRKLDKNKVYFKNRNTPDHEKK